MSSISFPTENFIANPVESLDMPSPSLALFMGGRGKLNLLYQESLADRWVYGVICAAVVAAYFVALMMYWSPAHSGTDQNGYLVGGKMFASTGSTGFTRTNPDAFVGRMWVETADGRFFPKYPLGMSLIYAASLKLGGMHYGPFLSYLVSPVVMAIGIAGMICLARLFVGTCGALIATLVFATSPVALDYAFNPDSHAAAVCCVTWGMFLLIRWWQAEGYGRAIGCGLLLGFAAQIRYTEGMLIAPIALVILMNLRWRERKSYAQSAALLAAWAVPVIVLFSYNWFSFHHLTGYDTTNESTGFSWLNFQNNWETMLREIYSTGLFFILPFSVLGLVLMFQWNWRVALVLALWVVPNIALYTAYYWAPDNASTMYLRFFLTIFPALSITAIWSLRELVRLYAQVGHRIVPQLSLGVLLCIGTGVNAYTATLDCENESRLEASYAVAGKLVLKLCPSGSTIFGPQTLVNDLQFVGNYNLYDVECFERRYIHELEHVDPLQPTGLQPRRAKELVDRMGKYSDAELERCKANIMKDALAHGQRAFYVTTTPAAAAASHWMAQQGLTTRIKAEWNLPADARSIRKAHWLGFNQPKAPVVDAPAPAVVFAVMEVESAKARK